MDLSLAMHLTTQPIEGQQRNHPMFADWPHSLSQSYRSLHRGCVSGPITLCKRLMTKQLTILCNTILRLLGNIGEDYPHLITGGAMVDQVQHLLSR
jgi:hypothetical protein